MCPLSSALLTNIRRSECRPASQRGATQALAATTPATPTRPIDTEICRIWPYIRVSERLSAMTKLNYHCPDLSSILYLQISATLPTALQLQTWTSPNRSDAKSRAIMQPSAWVWQKARQTCLTPRWLLRASKIEWAWQVKWSKKCLKQSANLWMLASVSSLWPLKPLTWTPQTTTNSKLKS